jgi:hypothetical protein
MSTCNSMYSASTALRNNALTAASAHAESSFFASIRFSFVCLLARLPIRAALVAPDPHRRMGGHGGRAIQRICA